MSPESIFLNLYTGALVNLQNTWMNDKGEINKEAFTIQINFIRNLIPDAELRKQIDREMDDVSASFRGGDAQYNYRQVHAGLAVVPHLVKFICDTYDLLHEDVIGPGTRKCFKGDDLLEVPDMVMEKKQDDS